MADHGQSPSAAERQVDEFRANAPAKRIEVYMLASRLKQMITAGLNMTMALSQGDKAGFEVAQDRFTQVSAGIEVLLDNLVLESQADAETNA